jgi:Fe-S cluster assembly iron-binding protein IscA
MVNLTETAVSKVREILDTQEPKPAGLRISVVGGGMLRVQLLDGLRERAQHAG